MPNKFVTSGYARFADDHYPTIDRRCIDALFLGWDVPLPALDPFCSTPETALAPAQVGDLHDASQYRSLVTNPPYARPLVDDLVRASVQKVKDGHVEMAALLMRSQWDHAKTRVDLLDAPFACSLRLLFRPYWVEERKASPIHNYQWLIWDRRHEGPPTIRHIGVNNV